MTHDTSSTSDDDPQRRLRFDPTINLGHLLTFAGFMVTIMITWSTMDKRVTVLEEARKVQEARDIAQDGRLSEKMGEIRDSLAELKRGVEQVRDKLERKP